MDHSSPWHAAEAVCIALLHLRGRSVRVRRRVVRRFNCCWLANGAARFWGNVNRHFEAARMWVRIEWCAENAAGRFAARYGIAIVLDRHNAHIDRVPMVIAEFIVAHCIPPSDFALAAQSLLMGSDLVSIQL